MSSVEDDDAVLLSSRPRKSLNSTEAVSSWRPRDILARMSPTNHEEIGRVGRVGRGCYDDPRKDVRRKSCASVGSCRRGSSRWCHKDATENGHVEFKLNGVLQVALCRPLFALVDQNTQFVLDHPIEVHNVLKHSARGRPSHGHA